MATKEEYIATALTALNALSSPELDLGGYDAGYIDATRNAAETAALIYTNTANAFIAALVSSIDTITQAAIANPVNISSTLSESVMLKFGECRINYLNSLTPE